MWAELAQEQWEWEGQTTVPALYWKKTDKTCGWMSLRIMGVVWNTRDIYLSIITDTLKKKLFPVY